MSRSRQYKVLLLPDVPDTARLVFEEAGYDVELVNESINEAILAKKAAESHVIGIGPKSNAQLTEDVLRASHRLLAIGCFGIDTSAVDIEIANEMGIGVFYSPFCDSASTAELVIGLLVALARQLTDRNRETHKGLWQKKSVGCFEVRSKTLGILGYSNTGSLVGVLAESIGMRVIWYDPRSCMPLGNSTSCENIEELLRQADFVSAHWSSAAEASRFKFSGKQFAMMKRGCYFLNTSYSDAVDLQALTDALKSGQCAGAAIDVFPNEPSDSGTSPYQDISSLANVILTPHLADVTVEAKAKIGKDIASQVTRYLEEGRSIGSANFPPIDTLPVKNTCRRIINVHRNVRGFVQEMDHIVSQFNINITKQMINTKSNVGYIIMDIDAHEVTADIVAGLAAMGNSIRTRIV